MAKTKKPGKTVKQEALARRPPKPAKKVKEPLSREERKKAAWQRKTERKAAQQAVIEVGTKASTGLTYGQLESSGLITRSRPATGPTFDQVLLEILKEQTRQFESAESVHLPMDALEPEIRIIISGEIFNNATVEDIVGPLGDVATREVVAAEIRSLLEKTGPIFSAYRGSDTLVAQLAAEELFEKEPEGSPLRLRIAEVVLADDPATGIEDLLEEVWDRVTELQLIAGSFEPENELKKSARLGLIDEAAADRLKKAAAKEAIRLDLSQRLLTTGASTGAPAEVDETFASLITEAAQAAESQRRERAAFRRMLSQGLRQRKEREGRRFSKSSEESGDEEFIRFLLSHRGNLAAVRDSLPSHLREQVEALLKDGERKGPLLRQIAAANVKARQLWAELKTRLATGADKPEGAVARNATAIKDLLGVFAQIRALHVQLEELD